MIFIVLALILWACASRSSRYEKGLSWTLRLSSIGCLLGALVFYAISINAVAQPFLRSLEHKYARPTARPDAIFVLGGDDDGQRERVGAKLQLRYGVEVVASGYKGEAERMRQVMLKEGVPDSKIITEPLATNTKDHVKYMLPIAKERGYKRIYVVTSAFHMPRSMLIFEEPFRNAGIEVLPYACAYNVPRKHVVIEEEEWLPNSHSLRWSATAWHEYLGMMAVRFF